MTKNKWMSRKFLMAVAAIVVDIVVGLGCDVDPEVIVGIAGGIASFWVLVEGVIDVKRK